MRAARARWGITPLLAAPLGAWALGLGNLDVKSALNQPLDAQIPLVATPQELERLRVSLASIETFQARGLDRPGYLSNLDFRVVTRNGQSFIHVTSRQPIKESLVTLIVEANWAAGSQQRMYDLLLDPPVFLPDGPRAAAVPQQAPPQNVAAGPVTRPVQQPASQPPQPTPQPTQQPAPQTAARPPQTPAPQTTPAAPPRTAPAPTPVPRAASTAPAGSYGPVQRSETLWAIADRYRPSGISMNQMMLAIFEANPQAFAGNMNLLQAGVTLRIPDEAAVRARTAAEATAEVQRQVDVWQGRTPATPAPGPRLVLNPPREAIEAAPAPQPAAVAASPPAAPANQSSPSTPLVPPLTPSTTPDDRPVEVTSSSLSNLQAAAANDTPAVTAGGDRPGVATDDIFVEDEPEPAEAVDTTPPAATPPVATRGATVSTPVEPEASLLDRIIAIVMQPTTLFAVAGAMLVMLAVGFVLRRRSRDGEDITGRWEALESEVDDEAREATQRMRRFAPADDGISVDETPPQETPRARRAAPTVEEAPAPRSGRAATAAAGAGVAAAATAAAAMPSVEDTQSSQTVINLDQADAIAEADFHVAYGLYDQAADLLTKALRSAPARRDLKIKLLEVYFMWGNKDAFLGAARDLRAEIGTSADADWNKVVIMGKQICPDEQLFASAGGGDAGVDLDLAGGDAPLDFAFEEPAGGGLDFELDEAAAGDDDALTIARSGTYAGDDAPTLAKSGAFAAKTAPRSAPKPSRGDDPMLDIGERTAAGLEAALFLDDEDEEQPTQAVGLRDDLAVTQEAATVERRGHDWQLAGDAPTVETPTIEAFGPDAPTMESPRFEARTMEAPTIEAPFGDEIELADDDEPMSDTRRGEPTIEQPTLAVAAGADNTAEINLDDLGLDVSDLEDLPGDLGERAIADDEDTGERLGLNADDELLSATGVTQVLRSDYGKDDDDFEARETAVLADNALGDGDELLSGTAIMKVRHDLDESTGDSQLVKALGKGEDIDLNLDDFSAALHGGDTVEQPRSFGADVFGGGDTPVDLDVGFDGDGRGLDNDDGEPLDAQTMTEVGTKLDLARAYIDMGDPEGARSILEEVLDEGDPGQRREAQGLIDALSA